MCYDDTVSKLIPKNEVPRFDYYRSNELVKFLRKAEPNLFLKKNGMLIYVGSKDELMNRKSDLVSKVVKLGYKGPIEPSDRYRRKEKPVTDVKMQQKIEEMEQLTDEELFNRIQDTFNSLSLLSEAASEIKIRSMIVSGSPGTGKTYEVLKAMKSQSSKNRKFYWHQIKGTISPIALYIELYRARDGVLILDDADEAFMESESLQLLKAATESSKERNVSYRKLSMALEAEGIPQEFIFNGCVIILTNTNLEEARKQRQSHYDAIMSRAHYINAILATDREKIMRIRHIITTTTMLHQFLDPSCHQNVIDFVEQHHTKFRELSIRTIVKLAELRAAFPTKWEVLARGTLLG